MAHSIGNVEPTKIMAGSSPVQKVYVGDVQVWPAAEGLYDVQVEYLPAYEVRFTAKTSYAESANDGFMFTSTPTQGHNGYVGRVSTQKWTSQTVQTCTIQDIYGGGSGGTMNTITVSVSPKP
jgi:protease II